MEFVCVKSPGDKQFAVYSEIIDRFLISLINGLKGTNFGLNTLEKESKRLCAVFNKLKQLGKKNKLYIDSGGYSIIVGDVHPRDLNKFIECYNHYLKKYHEYYDYIFSLDIPIFLKYPNYNTRQYIKDMNDLSIKTSSQVIKEGNLQDKFIYVWHFKLFEQYEIWEQIYNKYFSLNPLVNHSLGGMVGLRGITGIDFSPFIGMTFRILKIFQDTDSIMDNYTDKTRILHYLGINNKNDRFFAAFLEKLGNYYLKMKKCNSKLKITYDTIHFYITGQKFCKRLEFFDGEKWISGPSQCRDLIKKFFKSEQIQNQLFELVQLIENDNKLPELEAIAILNICSQVNIDKFFSDFLDKYNIIDIFIECTDNGGFHRFKNKVNSILYAASNKYPEIFTSNTVLNFLTNIQICYSFWYWLLKGGDLAEFKDKFKKFTDLINFPFKLA